MIDLSKFKAGNTKAPEIETPTFIPSYPTRVGESYWWDVLQGRAVPEQFAMSDMAAWAGTTENDGTGGADNIYASDQNNRMCAGITSDGKQFFIGAWTTTNTATTIWNVTLVERDSNSEQLTTRRSQSVTLASAASVAQITLTKMTEGPADTWFFIMGATNVNTGPDTAVLFKLEYDSGTGAYTFTRANTGMNTGVSAIDVDTLEIVYDPTNDNVIVFLPEGNGSPLSFYNHNATTMVRDIRRTITTAEPSGVTRASCYNSGFVFRLSDGNFLISAFADNNLEGGVYSYDGTNFTGIGLIGSSFNSSTGLIRITDDIFLGISGQQANVRQQLRVTYQIIQYDPGTTSLSAIVDETIYLRGGVAGRIIHGTSGNYGYIGNNWVYYSRNNQGWAAFQLDPTDSYRIKKETYQTGSDGISVGNIQWDSNLVVYSGGLYGEDTAGTNNGMCVATCSTGNLLNGYTAVPLGSLVSKGGGNDTIRVDVPYSENDTDVTAGDVFDEVVAASSNILVGRDLSACAINKGFLQTVSDSAASGNFLFSTTVDLNRIELQGNDVNGPTDIINFVATAGKTVNAEGFAYSAAGTEDSTIIWAMFNGIINSIAINTLSNASTTRPFYRAYGCKKAAAGFRGPLTSFGFSIEPRIN